MAVPSVLPTVCRAGGPGSIHQALCGIEIAMQMLCTAAAAEGVTVDKITAAWPTYSNDVALGVAVGVSFTARQTQPVL